MYKPTTVIRARDFSDKTTDFLRDRWTAGKLRHVIAALDRREVAITVETLTGHTVMGVTLVGLSSDRLYIAYGGAMGTTAHFIPSLGDTITPLDDPSATKGAKWTAVETWLGEKCAAIRVAKEEHGECEGRTDGRWEATPQGSSVHVRYTPAHEGASRRAWWPIPLSALGEDAARI